MTEPLVDDKATSAASVESWLTSLERARTQRRQGDAPSAIAATSDLLGQPLTTDLRMMVLQLRAAALGDAGDTQAKYADLAAALSSAKHDDLPRWVVRASALAAATALELGHVARALDHAVDALVAAQDPRVEIEDHLSAAASLGSLFTHIGAPGVSAKILEGACRRVESVNELPWVAYVTLVNLGHALGQVVPLLTGDEHCQAAERAKQVNEIVIAADAAGKVCRDAARGNHAILLARLGQSSQAQAQLDALEMDPQTLAPDKAATVYQARGQIALANGLPAQAHELLSRAVACYAEAGLPLEEVTVREQCALAHQALGDLPAALTDLRLALVRSQNSGREGIERLAGQVFTRAQDVLERRSLADIAKTLEEANMQDPLTGLGNRRRWERLVAERGGQPVGLLLCDLDRFKSVNDDFGHDTGDSVLRRVSKLINATARSGDIVIRWGGEEFLVVVSIDMAAGPQRQAERLCDAVATACWDDLLRDGRGVTLSIGVAKGNLGDPTLVFRADEAMYAAKLAGRNRVVSAS
jgi:diguanylate cyclase (GGDEF)-like protein